MAAKEVKNVLASLGAAFKKAHEEHKNDDVQVSSIGDLPPGIIGVAQLNSIKFGIYASGDFKGKPYWMAMGTVHVPKVFKGINIEGLFTKTGPNPLCDTPKRTKAKTLSDNVGILYQMLKRFNVNTEELEHTDIQPACELLVQEAPLFRFSTTKGKARNKNEDPPTWHNWGPVITDDELASMSESANGEEEVKPDTEDDTADSEGEEVEEVDKPTKVATQKPTPTTASKGGKPPTKTPPFNEFEESEEEEEKTESNDEDENDDGEEVEVEKAEYIPKVGDVGFYAPKGKKKQEVVVTKVKMDGTCTVKSLVDNKTLYVIQQADLLVDED